MLFSLYIHYIGTRRQEMLTEVSMYFLSKHVYTRKFKVAYIFTSASNFWKKNGQTSEAIL